MQLLYYLNDNTIELDGLRDVDGNYVNDATVVLTEILDSSGVQVGGASWPVTMAYVAASNGKYRCSVDKALAILPSKRYRAIIDAVSTGRDGHWDRPCLAIVRSN